jgi:hypothetical protein
MYDAISSYSDGLRLRQWHAARAEERATLLQQQLDLTAPSPNVAQERPDEQLAQLAPQLGQEKEATEADGAVAQVAQVAKSQDEVDPAQDLPVDRRVLGISCQAHRAV